MLPWTEIDTVLLDMDGTLLDLHFDHHLWTELVPHHYAKANQLSLVQVKQWLSQQYQLLAEKLDWYCLDYWQRTLRLDVLAIHHELSDLIRLRPETLSFLKPLRSAGKQLHILTNAHPDNFALKLQKTGLNKYVDRCISSHQFGYAKEDQRLWQALAAELPFDKQRTLFIDDSLPVLAAAQQFGIGHLIAVANPNSRQPAKSVSPFTGIMDLTQLLPATL